MIERAAVHLPTYEGTTTGEWNPPVEGDAQALAGHYLLSTTGFPPANRSDLALAVVDADGNLHRAALIRARAECRQRPELTVSVSNRGIELTSALLRTEFEGSGPPEAGQDRSPTEAERTLAELTIPGRRHRVHTHNAASQGRESDRDGPDPS